MSRKIKFDDIEYDVESLSQKAREKLDLLEFTSKRMQEMKHEAELIHYATAIYEDRLKKEILSRKAGLLLGDD